MNRHLILMISLLMQCGLLQAQKEVKENVNKDPYPYGNPVVKHMYTADAAPHVMPDGKVWMVTSVDHEDGGGYETMHSYHTYSSSDMKDWKDHGEILHIDDIKPKDTPNEKWALWAPDMIYRNGKYYLYYPVRILHTDTVRANGGRVVSTFLGVAESDDPSKKFKVINPRIEGTRGIDPSVFIDDDDTPYIYWGSHLGAILDDNMKELKTKPKKLDVGTDRFMEAVWMNKINGEYHISYHTKYDWKIKITKDNHLDPNRKKSELAYSVGKSPMGPFKFAGTLNYELGTNVDVKNAPKSPEGNFVPWKLTQSNHGGIVEYHGQEYLFYHTSALSSWRQDRFKGEGTWTQRSVCVDKLNYDKNGKIIPVQQTIEGVSAVKIKQPYAINLKAKKATLTASVSAQKETYTVKGKKGVVSFKKVNLGSGYYYFDLKVEKAETKATVEVRLDKEDGKLLGTIRINENATSLNKGVLETFLRDANGKHDIYVVVKKDNASDKLVVLDLRFFAGSPVETKDM